MAKTKSTTKRKSIPQPEFRKYCGEVVEVLPINDMFAQSKYRGTRGSGQHGPVKVIYSRDAHPVVDPPTRVGMLAGELRRKAPRCEFLLRDALKRHFGGKGITFQHSVAMLGYIADFYCPERRVIIELDGPMHQDRAVYDRKRDQIFAANGIRTFRFPSSMAYKMPILLARIERAMNSIAGT